MYFDFDDSRPDVPTIASPLSRREGVLLSIIVHLVVVIAILVGPSLPFMKALEANRQQRLEEARQRELERQRDNARFVFVQPRVEIPVLEPRPNADLSDLSRRARTVERAPNPTNDLAFSRGSSFEPIVGDSAAPGRRETPSAEPAQSEPASSTPSLELPDAAAAPSRRAEQRPQLQARGPAVGAIADAIRNVQRYTQTESLSNPSGGANQQFSPDIDFDTKGVEFGPWVRRFKAQVERNWFPLIPYAAMTMRGRVVIAFYVHRDGRITDIKVMKPSAVEGFTNSAYSAIATSNPTHPLPPEYPDAKVLFTVTFHFNERPYAP